MNVLRLYNGYVVISYPLITFGATDFDDNPVTIASGDSQWQKLGGLFANLSILKLPFTSGGTTEPVIGDVIDGATSGAQATIRFIQITSGSWAGGDAAGDIWFESQTGAFQAEDLDINGGAANVATIAADSSAGLFGYKGNGSYYSVLTPTEFQTAHGTLHTIDQDVTKTWEDQCMEVDSYGNASAQHEFDLDTAGLTVTEIVGATWKELLNQAQYSTNHMAGKHLRDAAHAGAVHDGTLQAATATTITLAATASAVDGFYEQMRVILTDNTGAGQAAIILAYDGTSKVAKIAPTWRTTPDDTTDYVLQPALVHSETSGMCLLAGYATAGGASSITLDADASAIDDFYNGQVIILHHDGAAEGQSKRILDYDGTTKVATVASAWITVPSSGTQYAIKAAQIDAKDSDDYQTGTRGSGLWTSGGTAGSVVVTLHTETTLGNDVPDAGLTVRNAAGDSVITAGRSDLATSDFGLNLNPGTYLVYPLKSAHTAASPQTIVVTTGPVTFAIVIDPMTITAPTDPTLCNITGRAADAGGNFREGTIVLAKYVVPGTAQGLLGHSGGVSASTDADGNYLLPLIKTAVVEVTSAFLGYKDTQFTVPDADNQDMATWTPDVV